MERQITESNLRLRIEHLFKEPFVIITFPQLDVHLDSQKLIEIHMVKPEDNGGIND